MRIAAAFTFSTVRWWAATENSQGNFLTDGGSFHDGGGGVCLRRACGHRASSSEVRLLTASCTVGAVLGQTLSGLCCLYRVSKSKDMRLLEGDSISRFRVFQSCVGLAGCLCVIYAVWTPFWLKDRGLWTPGNDTQTEPSSDNHALYALEAQRVFAVLSFLMAASTSALCLVFALCWTSQTVHSYSNTRSLLMAGQALYPTTLLLLTMSSTGFFFLLSWSLFTYHHREEIHQDFSGLGSSYWLGALGWALLLVVETIVFIAEQAVVPDILPDLEKAVESWLTHKAPVRSMTDSRCSGYR